MRMWKGCRKQGGTRLGKEPRKDTCLLYLCSLIDASRNVQGREEVCSQMCLRALTGKQTLLGGGAHKPGHSASLERLAQLGDALGGVGAIAITIDAAELVVGQTAMGKEACQWALT